MTLHVARGLDFPDEYMAYKAGILATSGAGKSNVAVVLAEEMWKAGLPWVAIDPKGDWYGMRASADAQKPGLPVPILGGLHGDVPLESRDGRTVARMIASRRMTCIVDVSEFESLQDMWRFLTEFAQELLRVNREPLHVFAEEAADYLPQTKSESGWLPKCVNAWRRVVSHGRNHGVGVTLISQRSAKIDKEALDLIETLIAMRATSKRDRDAIKGWVETHDVATELVDSLPELADGEAWVWSPHRFKLMQRVQFRRRSTFDSGATPLLAGVAASRPASIADVDLAALKDEFAETIEKAKADDPAELRAALRKAREKIRDLEDEVMRERDKAAIAPVVERVPFIPEGVMTASILMSRAVDEAIERLRSGMIAADSALASAQDEIESVPVDTPPREAQPAALAVPDQTRRSGRGDGRRVSRSGPASASPRGTDRQGPTRPDAVHLRAGARRMLEALAQWGELNRPKLATISQVKKGGTFSTYLGDLVRAGLAVDRGAVIEITELGYASAGVESVPTDPESVLAYWRPRFRAGARRMLDVIIESGGITRDELSDRADVSKGGTFSTYLGDLIRAGLVEEFDGVIRLQGWLR